jgi:uncharacterized protein YceK
MKKILILIMTLSLLTACSSSASSDSQTDSQTTEESSVVYEDVRVKDIIFPASSKITLDSWSDLSYSLVYNNELNLTVRMTDLSNSSLKDKLKIDDEDFAKGMFASLELLSVSDDADSINSEVTYSDSGFKIYSFTKDDVYAYYATQVINDTYYEIKATSKHYKYYLSDSDKELKEYFDDICEIINSIKPA